MKVYWIDVADFSKKCDLETGLHKVLSAKRAKIQDKQRYDSLTAWLLVRYALQQENALSLYEEIAFYEKGKPYLPNGEYHFSLSHAKGRAICVISDAPIGCDLEKIRATVPKFIKKILTPEEALYFHSCSEEEKRLLFYPLWTAKESLAKYHGGGLSLPFSKLKLYQNETLIAKNYLFDKTLFFRNYTLSDYTFTICSESSDFPNILQEVSLKMLLEY